MKGQKNHSTLSGQHDKQEQVRPQIFQVCEHVGLKFATFFFELHDVKERRLVLERLMSL